MNCDEVTERLDAYSAGELSAEQSDRLAAHLATCPICAQESAFVRALREGLSQPEPVDVPDGLWAAIRTRLDRETGKVDRRPIRTNGRPQGSLPGGAHPRRRALAIAASIILVLGLGTVLFNRPDLGLSRAEASTVNFGILLSGLPLNPDKALRRFLVLYDAKQIAQGRAHAYAPELNFSLPRTLPGGFVLGPVYGLRFGQKPGIAAKYTNGSKMVAVIFHPPVGKEDFGTHRDYPCVIGKHRGHSVPVGKWTLVHLTDPTTCHCVLSRLDTTTELPEVFAAVAPTTGRGF